jgi:hypothetical protein
MTTGCEVAMVIAAVRGSRLRQFPPYVPPCVMTIGADQAIPEGGAAEMTEMGEELIEARLDALAASV